MAMKKLTVALIIIGFAALPVQAGDQAAMQSDGTLTQGMITTTAACAYGYAKSKKTGKCIELKCGTYKMLDKNGHKCVAKPKPKATGSSTHRGSS